MRKRLDYPGSGVATSVCRNTMLQTALTCQRPGRSETAAAEHPAAGFVSCPERATRARRGLHCSVRAVGSPSLGFMPWFQVALLRIAKVSRQRLCEGSGTIPVGEPVSMSRSNATKPSGQPMGIGSRPVAAASLTGHRACYLVAEEAPAGCGLEVCAAAGARPPRVHEPRDSNTQLHDYSRTSGELCFVRQFLMADLRLFRHSPASFRW